MIRDSGRIAAPRAGWPDCAQLRLDERAAVRVALAGLSDEEREWGKAGARGYLIW